MDVRLGSMSALGCSRELTEVSALSVDLPLKSTAIRRFFTNKFLLRGQGESACGHNDRSHDEHLGEPIAPVNKTELPWLVIPQTGAHQHRDWESYPNPKSKIQCVSQAIYRELPDE